jgi:hypothetical protein
LQADLAQKIGEQLLKTTQPDAFFTREALNGRVRMLLVVILLMA